MAQLVGVFGVGHNPQTTAFLANTTSDHPGVRALQAHYADAQRRLAAARPDVVLAVGSDHLNQWSTENMPAFLVGKAPVAEGPFLWEREHGVPAYQCPVAHDVAVQIIRGGYDLGVDFAYSDEFRLDHALIVPLHTLLPGGGTPIVPVFTNAMIPPLPTPARYHQVGAALRSIINGMESSLRVAVVCSGHLSLEIGGPRGWGWNDPAFDQRAVGLVAQGDSAAFLREFDLARLYESGNATRGFLNFVLAMGLANDRRPDVAGAVDPGWGEGAPFFIWDSAEALA
jgi:protocatechuate 4,5-dioxygenase beta chain